MRRLAFPALSGLALISWAASAGLVALLFAFGWNSEARSGMVGLIILLTGAGIAREIRASHDGCIDQVLGALVAGRPTPEPRQQPRRPAA